MNRNRIKSRTCSALAAPVLMLLVVGHVAPPATAAGTPSLAPVIASPAREPSPFTSTSAFCSPDRSKRPPNLEASAPGVTKRRIRVVFFTPVANPVAEPRIAAGVPGDPVREARTFGELVNRCGGILGRKVDVHIEAQTSNPSADCLRAAQLDAFVVVSWTTFDGASCIAQDRREVMIASGTQAPNDALLTTQGRLAVGSTSDGILAARVLDLVQSGRLDHKRVNVVATQGQDQDARSVRQLLAAADPSRRIALVGGPGAPPDRSADVVITTSFEVPFAELARSAPRPSAVYSLGDVSDQALDAVRINGGVDAARALNDAGLYGWISPDLADFRENDDPTSFTSMCNRAYATATPGPSTTQPQDGDTTTTVAANLPGGPYLQVAKVCLAWRITARALYDAGPNPTERTLVRALFRLPYVDTVSDTPKSRPNQVINEPVTRAGLPVFLAKAEYPCVHPRAPRAPADDRMCWVPVSGWGNGHAVNAAA